MHICPCSWAVGISKKKKIRFRPILSRWRSILWRFSTIWHFGATEPDLPAFSLYTRTDFLEAHLLCLKWMSMTHSLEAPYIHTCNMPRLFFSCDMTHSHMTEHTFIFTWIMHLRHHKYIRATWLIHSRHVTWLIHTWQNTFIRMTHSLEATYIHATWPIRLIHVTCLIHTRHNTH